MITSIVAAIAISQREARRKKAEQEAELEAASKKSILVVSAGTSGLATAFLLSQFGFAVTIVDERGEVDILDHEDPLTVIPGMTVELICKAGRLEGDQKLAEALEEIDGAESLTYRRYKSSKPLLTTPLSSTDALIVLTEDLHALLSDYTKAELHTNTRIISYHDAPEDLDGPLPNGRPYALAESGEKFYADLLIVCYGGGVARKHVCDSAGCDDPPLKPTQWSTYSGVVDLEDYPGVREGANTWVGDESYLTGYKDSGEWFFMLHHLSDIDDILDHLKKWAPEVRNAVQKATCTRHRNLTARAPPASTVSRKSRKLLLMAEEALTLPPHSPHLPFAMHLESVATLAVCLRKAASVPLALEVYTRLRASRIEDAFKIGMTRLNTITESAEDEELEASEVKWNVEDPWWTFQADKVADAKFELVIEILTQELLGKQKAMLEAEARRKEEEEKAKAAVDQAADGMREEAGEEEIVEDETREKTEQDDPALREGKPEEPAPETKTEVQHGASGSVPDGPVTTKKTEKLRQSSVVAQDDARDERGGEEGKGKGTPTVAEQAHPAKTKIVSTLAEKRKNAEIGKAKTVKPRQPSVADEDDEEVEEESAAEKESQRTAVKSSTRSPSDIDHDSSSTAEIQSSEALPSKPNPRARRGPDDETKHQPKGEQQPTSSTSRSPPPNATSSQLLETRRITPPPTEDTVAKEPPSPYAKPEPEDHPHPPPARPAHAAASPWSERERRKSKTPEKNTEAPGTARGRQSWQGSVEDEQEEEETEETTADEEREAQTPTRRATKTRTNKADTVSSPSLKTTMSPTSQPAAGRHRDRKHKQGKENTTAEILSSSPTKPLRHSEAQPSPKDIGPISSSRDKDTPSFPTTPTSQDQPKPAEFQTPSAGSNQISEPPSEPTIPWNTNRDGNGSRKPPPPPPPTNPQSPHDSGWEGGSELTESDRRYSGEQEEESDEEEIDAQ